MRRDSSGLRTPALAVAPGPRQALAVFGLMIWASLTLSAAASAETLKGALTRAYSANPLLNAQRANVLATKQNIPRAQAGYLPKVSATGDIGYLSEQDQIQGIGTPLRYESVPRGGGLQVTQTLFDGFRTASAVTQAEAQVTGARAALRNAEGDMLFAAVVAYMDVLRDAAILELNRNNVAVLEEHLRLTRERHGFGEVTHTDVSQSEARLAGAHSLFSLTEGILKTSGARYRQVVGIEPVRLVPARPVDRLLPASLGAAIDVALSRHPAIEAARYGVDAALAQVSVTKAELFPTVSLNGSVARRYDFQVTSAERYPGSLVGSVLGQITIPIYDGGGVYARTRQASEVAGQRRLEASSVEDGVRAAVTASWGQLEAAKAQLGSAFLQVKASEAALIGVRNEYRVGQRTTLDVLNSSQDLLVARSNLIAAQRDRVVASYAVAQATGRLSLSGLGPEVEGVAMSFPPARLVNDKPILRATLPVRDAPFAAADAPAWRLRGGAQP